MSINHGGGSKFTRLAKIAKKHGDVARKVVQSDTFAKAEGIMNQGANLMTKSPGAKDNAKNRITNEILDGKSLVNKVGVFGPGTYKYLIYIILFLNICCIILLTFNKNKFFKLVGNDEVDVRLNKNVFYIYIFSLFLFILQLYTFKENYNDLDSMRYAMTVTFGIFIPSAISFFIVSRVLPRDWAAAEKRNLESTKS